MPQVPPRIRLRAANVDAVVEAAAAIVAQVEVDAGSGIGIEAVQIEAVRSALKNADVLHVPNAGIAEDIPGSRVIADNPHPVGRPLLEHAVLDDRPATHPNAGAERRAVVALLQKGDALEVRAGGIPQEFPGVEVVHDDAVEVGVPHQLRGDVARAAAALAQELNALVEVDGGR
jgi:hypothetical protein